MIYVYLVPRSVTEGASDIVTFNGTNATVFLNIPVIIFYSLL